MRTLKILFFGAVISIAAIFAYANVRKLSPTQQLKEVHLASFQIAGDLNTEQRIALEKKVSEQNGVTACTINSTGTLASIIFYPELINANSLIAVLSNNDQLQITQRELAVSGGCPVHAVSASVEQFVSVLDLRN
jgi:hypothetical protein